MAGVLGATLPWDTMAWNSSKAKKAMTVEQQGAYRNLLDAMWIEGGHLDDDDAMLARASDLHERWPEHRETIMKWLKKEHKGWTNLRLKREVKRRRAYLKKQRANSKLATAARLHKKNSPPVGSPRGDPRDVPTPTLSSSSSSSLRNKRKIPPNPPRGEAFWQDILIRWAVLIAAYGGKKLEKIGKARRKGYLLRREEFPDFWDVIERELPLMGKERRKERWFGFDFLVKSENNFSKFAEGNYRGEFGEDGPGKRGIGGTRDFGRGISPAE